MLFSLELYLFFAFFLMLFSRDNSSLSLYTGRDMHIGMCIYRQDHIFPTLPAKTYQRKTLSKKFSLKLCAESPSFIFFSSAYLFLSSSDPDFMLLIRLSIFHSTCHNELIILMAFYYTIIADNHWAMKTFWKVQFLSPSLRKSIFSNDCILIIKRNQTLLA